MVLSYIVLLRMSNSVIEKFRCFFCKKNEPFTAFYRPYISGEKLHRKRQRTCGGNMIWKRQRSICAEEFLILR